MYFTCNMSHSHSAVKLCLCTPLGHMRKRRGSCNHHRLRHYMGCICQLHAPTATPPGERVPGTYCNIRLGGYQNRSGRFGGEVMAVMEQFLGLRDRIGVITPAELSLFHYCHVASKVTWWRTDGGTGGSVRCRSRCVPYCCLKEMKKTMKSDVSLCPWFEPQPSKYQAALHCPMCVCVCFCKMYG